MLIIEQLQIIISMKRQISTIYVKITENLKIVDGLGMLKLILISVISNLRILTKVNLPKKTL